MGLLTSQFAIIQRRDSSLKPDGNDNLSFVAFTNKDGAPKAAKRKLPNSPGLPQRKRHKGNDDAV